MGIKTDQIVKYEKNGNMSKKLTIVMYHYVRDLRNSRYPEIKGLQTEMFVEQLHFLKKHYNFVKMEDVIDAFHSNHVDELPAHPVLLTFDDAYQDHFQTVFPILMQEHVQGCFYAPIKALTQHEVLDVNKIHFILASTNEAKFPALLNEIKILLEKNQEKWNLQSFDDYYAKLAEANRFDNKDIIFVKRLLQVALPEELRKEMTSELFQRIIGIEESAFSRELYMSKAQIRCMVQCGMHVGSHGYDHYWLNSLSREKQESEICKSMDFLKSVGVNMNYWTMCYPYGAYNDDTLQILKAYNCKMGLTTKVALAELTDRDMIYSMPRLDTNDLPKDANANVNNWYV